MSSTCPEADSLRAHRTRVIAHRGASGYLPEHTTAAKVMAYGLGADFLEQDVIATRDEVPVVLHDIYLNDISDVEAHYPGRQRDDGRFYVIDFTFAELEVLSLTERRRPGKAEQAFPSRFPFESSLFRIVRLDEEIRLIAGLNATTGRSVGLYPEIKDPGWHAQNGIDLTLLVHRTLDGMQSLVSGPVFVQSFDENSLRRLAADLESGWPRIQLLSSADALRLAGAADRLASIRKYACGVGLPFDTLIRVGANGMLQPSEVAEQLSESGLYVHPYTLRRDAPATSGIEYATALEFLIRELRVDAIFCDQPDDAIAVRATTEYDSEV